ncbi:hypothetical protein CBR_g29774 [Chara braunii]|uniref:BRCT domain-containing protein n=1 Tax=Chara braunii TaxID=69332 RepID=A0A388LBC4_CHABU|nr:hypothetical protein CBR_g29774 [Chara braunii]|eukprot:GBG79625.1 hypothetical protein CBR_g29774 [Chara braunii]
MTETGCYSATKLENDGGRLLDSATTPQVLHFRPGSGTWVAWVRASVVSSGCAQWVRAQKLLMASQFARSPITVITTILLSYKVLYRPVPDVNGIPGAETLAVCLTGYEKPARIEIEETVKLIGAGFTKHLSKDNTHLICYKFEGKKYEMAIRLRLHVVNHLWLEDSGIEAEQLGTGKLPGAAAKNPVGPAVGPVSSATVGKQSDGRDPSSRMPMVDTPTSKRPGHLSPLKERNRIDFPSLQPDKLGQNEHVTGSRSTGYRNDIKDRRMQSPTQQLNGPDDAARRFLGDGLGSPDSARKTVGDGLASPDAARKIEGSGARDAANPSSLSKQGDIDQSAGTASKVSATVCLSSANPAAESLWAGPDVDETWANDNVKSPGGNVVITYVKRGSRRSTQKGGPPVDPDKQLSRQKTVKDIAVETGEAEGGISATVAGTERTPILDRRKNVEIDLDDEDTQPDDDDSVQRLWMERHGGAVGKNNEADSSEVNSGDGGGPARKEEGREEGVDVTVSDEQMLKAGVGTADVEENVEKQAVSASECGTEVVGGDIAKQAVTKRSTRQGTPTGAVKKGETEGGPVGVKNSETVPSVTERRKDAPTAERKSIELRRSDIDSPTINTSLLEDDQAAGQKSGRRRSSAGRMCHATVAGRKSPSALEDNGPLRSTGGAKPQVEENDGETRRAVDDSGDLSDKSGTGKGKDSIVSVDGKQGSSGQKRRMDDDRQEVDLQSDDAGDEVKADVGSPATENRKRLKGDKANDGSRRRSGGRGSGGRGSVKGSGRGSGRGTGGRAQSKGRGRGRGRGGRTVDASPTVQEPETPNLLSRGREVAEALLQASSVPGNGGKDDASLAYVSSGEDAGKDASPEASPAEKGGSKRTERGQKLLPVKRNLETKEPTQGSRNLRAKVGTKMDIGEGKGESDTDGVSEDDDKDWLSRVMTGVKNAADAATKAHRAGGALRKKKAADKLVSGAPTQDGEEGVGGSGKAIEEDPSREVIGVEDGDHDDGSYVPDNQSKKRDGRGKAENRPGGGQGRGRGRGKGKGREERGRLEKLGDNDLSSLKKPLSKTGRQGKKDDGSGIVISEDRQNDAVDGRGVDADNSARIPANAVSGLSDADEKNPGVSAVACAGDIESEVDEANEENGIHDRIKRKVREEIEARVNIRRNMKDGLKAEEPVSKEKAPKAKGKGVQKKVRGRGGGRGKMKGELGSSAEQAESLEGDGSRSTNAKRLQDTRGGSGEGEAHDESVGPVVAKVGENGGGVKRSMKACVSKANNVTAVKCFALTGDYGEKEQAKAIIKRLKGKLCGEKHTWKDSATHLILQAPKRTEKVFAAVAGGRWLLQPSYLLSSLEAGSFVDESKHEWSEESTDADDVIDLRAPRKWREQRETTGCGAFHGLKVVFYGAEGFTKPPMDTLKRAIHAGGGHVSAVKPPYTRFLSKGIDFAIVKEGVDRDDDYVEQFLEKGVACVTPEFFLDFVLKPSAPREQHILYSTEDCVKAVLKRQRARIDAATYVSQLPPSQHECEDSDQSANLDVLACEVCGKADKEDKMVLCGDDLGKRGCGIGTHIFCMTPPLKRVPDEDWFCNKCKSPYDWTSL